MKRVPSQWVSASPKRKKLRSQAWVIRTPGTSAGDSFLACVGVGPVTTRTCKKGRNPRAALAAALHDLGSKIKNRRGAFAGMAVKQTSTKVVELLEDNKVIARLRNEAGFSPAEARAAKDYLARYARGMRKGRRGR